MNNSEKISDLVYEDLGPMQLGGLLEEISMALVDDYGNVEVIESGADTPTSLLTIKVADSDVSKILGKQGSTIKAIRELISKMAAARGRRAIVEIIDPKKRQSGPTKTT